MNDPFRSTMRSRVLRQAVQANVDEIRGRLPRGLRRSRSNLERLSRLLVVAIAIVLGSAVCSSIADPSAGAIRARGDDALASATGALAALTSDRTEMVAASQPSVAETSAARAIDPAVLRLGARRIMIDAGHGGSDSGARTARGLSEKDLTLDIAVRLELLLRDAGFAVAMTRSADETVPLRERSMRANRARADLFVSIHLNSLPQPTRHGIETYYLGPPSDAQGEWLAGAENERSGYSIADARRLLEGIYVNMRAAESRALAEAVQRQLFDGFRRTSANLEDRGVKTAPFAVLVGTAMPAILAEVSCVSSDEDQLLLEQPSHRQRIAEALARGIRDYAASDVERGLLAAVASNHDKE